MAMIQFLKGTQANLNALTAEQIIDGALYFTTDSHKMYMGVGTALQEYSAIEVAENIAGLPAVASAVPGKFYYAKTENVFCFPGADGWHQVNPDTGATSIEVVGEGNAVTGASYDPAARKITLTKGATYTTGADVDGKINAKVGEIPANSEGAAQTVRQYIDAKTSGIASDEALTALGNRVTELEKVDHDHTNKAELDKIAVGDKALWDAEKGANAAIAAMKEGATVVTFKGVEEAIATAKTELQGYADTAEADALAAAKTYADGKDTAIAAAKQAGDDAQADVDALAGKVGEVPADKTVVGMIAEAQTAATYDDTEVRGLIQGNADAIGVLNGDETQTGSVKKTVADEIAKVIAGAPESFDTLKEVSDWIATHGQDAAAMNTAILALQAIVDGIGDTENGEKATVVAYVTDAIAALNIGDYAKAADLTALANRVAAMEAKVTGWDQAVTDVNAVKADYLKAADKTELEGKITAAQTAAEKVANDNNAAMNTRVEALEAINHEAYKAYADQAETDAVDAAKAYADGLAGNYDSKGAAAKALTDAQAYADTAEADAVAAAKAHAEGLMTWGSF